MLVALFVTIRPKREKSITLKWILYCAGAFLCNGIGGVVMKMQQSTPEKGEISQFLTITYATSALFIAGMWLYYRLKKKLRLTIKKEGNMRPFLLFSIGTGISTGVSSYLNQYLTGEMPSVFFFTVANGSVILLAAFAARIFFREKLEMRQVIGVLLGTVGIALVGNVLTMFMG